MRASVSVWLIAATVVAAVATSVEGKTDDYVCRGSEGAGAALKSNVNVTVSKTEGVGYEFTISPDIELSWLVGGPNLTHGIVFLPESHVAPEAYAPLARALALSGCYAAIVEKATAGRVVQAMMQRPELEYWTLAGHGRGGGSLAARLALTLLSKVKALVLLAAALPEEVDLADLNVVVVALYGRKDTVVTAAAVEKSFDRMPGDADVVAFARLGHYDFADSTCAGNALRPGPSGLTDANFATIVTKIIDPVRLSSWAPAGKKALSFSDNERLVPGKNISKPYPGDIRVYYMRVRIPNSHPWRWWWAFIPTEIKGGLAYYPGAAVDARAYFPLAFQIAARGHLVVIIQMPLRFASYHYKEANAVFASPAFSQVPHNKWAVGGHSLGGAAATLYAAEFGTKVYAGVLHSSIWLGNLSLNPLPVVSIYGTLDSVVPGGEREGTDYSLVNLNTSKFVPVVGGNHYQVGDYGYQYPDEVAVISLEQQWSKFASETVAFLDGVAAALN